MKAFLSAIVVMALITVSAAVVLSILPSSSQDAFTERNVRL